MKLIFEQGAEGHCLHLLPACDVPEYQLSAERTAPAEAQSEVGTEAGNPAR